MKAIATKTTIEVTLTLSEAEARGLMELMRHVNAEADGSVSAEARTVEFQVHQNLDCAVFGAIDTALYEARERP